MHPLLEQKVPKDQVAVHWFGQSSYAFKLPGGTIVLVDPYFPHERPREKFIHPEVPLVESELPADVVLLTHDHSDHTHPETLLRILAASPKVVFVGPPESAARLKKAGTGGDRFVVVRAGSAFGMGGMMAHFVWAKPEQGDPEAQIAPPDVTHLGVVLDCGVTCLYVTGDLIRTFAGLPELTDPVRALAPQVGFLTCHPTEGEFPLFDGSARMAQAVGLKLAFPSHYDCFVKRTYDPAEWAKAFAGTGVATRILGYNQTMLVP